MNTTLKPWVPCFLLCFAGLASAQEWRFDVTGPAGLEGEARIRGQELRLRLRENGCQREVRGRVLQHHRDQLRWSFPRESSSCLADLGRARPGASPSARISRMRADQGGYTGWVLGRQLHFAPRGPRLTLSGNHPTARLEREGDAWLLTSVVETQVLAVRPDAELSFDGHQVALPVAWTELISTSELATRIPPGYSLEDLGERRVGDRLECRFRLHRDPPGTLTLQEAARLGREQLIADLKNVHSQSRAWQGTFATQWSQMRAEGVARDLDAFFDPAGATQVYISADEYLFVGRGPYDLYTEVRVSKSTPHSSQTMVEID